MEKLKQEFYFIEGNYLILIISWILMDFAGELPGTYYSDYVIQLGGSATILGLITLVSMLAMASVQFPGGYLADKYGRRWLISTLTFGVALIHFLRSRPELALHFDWSRCTERVPTLSTSIKRYDGRLATS